MLLALLAMKMLQVRMRVQAMVKTTVQKLM
jgi:hypothetical protein